ncbi:MAG TPA: PAS domain-containing protein [Candidatus Coprenecus pullicola]|nr:PAS domain-containing protein [Candidatus Coprenecus pullicola]
MGARGYFRLIAVSILVLTVGTAVLVLVLPPEHRSWTYLAIQLCAIAVILLLVILYRKTVKPLGTLSEGIDLLKEQDFSTRLRQVGQADADRIIELFNRMSRQLHEEEVRAQEQNHFLELLIAASPMGVLIMDIDGKISSANPAMCRFLNLTDIGEYKGLALDGSGLPLLQLMASVEPDSGRILQTDPLHIYRCTCSSFMDRGFPHPFYMVEPLTEELYEAEKRGYRKVIRIISHEVNNTMAGLTSALGAMEQSSAGSGDEDTASMLSILLSRIDRMSRFITEYASMARIPDPVCRPVEANTFLRRTAPFLESLKGRRQIAQILDLDDNAGEVSIDPVLMEQVLTNIVKNAVEAFPPDTPDTASGTAESVQPVPHSKPYLSRNQITIVSRPGYWCISDNGLPIPEEAARNLFTPFFSTKPDGKGIGLTVIHEILTRSGIRFSLATGPDGLTRFELFFR